jgi:hypothetical protein
MAKQFPDKLKPALQKAYQLSTLVASQRPDIPPTREEVGHLGVTKKDLKELERYGLLQTFHMNVTENLRNGFSTTTGRVVFKMTAVGHEVCDQLGFKPWKVPAQEPVLGAQKPTTVIDPISAPQSEAKPELPAEAAPSTAG